jgi:hypothetical protein
MLDSILNEVFKALGYLFVAWIVMYTYKTARKNSVDGKYVSVLWKGFLWCAGIAFFMSMMLGNPTCIDTEYSMYGSGCNEYADDGFEPSTEQRTSTFAYYLTLLYLPVAIGAFKEK